jgi:uncharacterized membrane protein
MSSRISESIEVDVDLQTVYNQWTQFEDFPEFMNNVERVEQVDDVTLNWTGNIAGAEREWTAKITDQTPDERVEWRAEGEITQTGTVTFDRVAADRTRVNLELEFAREDWKEKAADALNVTERRVKGDLERFKEFIEERGRETGAWRGEVDDERRVP